MNSLPATDLAFRQWLSGRLNPSESTSPSDVLYVPLNEGTNHDPIQLIERDIRFNPSGSLNFISGFSGSGKSTQLRRLQNMLQRGSYFTVIADADEYFLPSEAVDIDVLLIKLAAAYCDQLDKLEGKDATHQSYGQRFWQWLSRTDVALESVDLSAGLSAGHDKVAKAEFATKLKIALKESPSLIEKVQEVRKTKPGVIRAQLHDFFAEVTQQMRADKLSVSAPVLILDSFEKLQDSTQTNGGVTNSIITILTNHLSDLNIPEHHVVLTMPPWIKLLKLGQDKVRLLYGVKLWVNNKRRTKNEEGYRLMREVVKKRFTEEGLERFFGPAEQGHPRPLVEALIAASGGHLRDLIILFRETLLRASEGTPPAGQAIATTDNVRDAIANQRNAFSRLSDADAICLHNISEERRPWHADSMHDTILIITNLLNNHYAFLLPNDDEWCDVHPLALKAVNQIIRRLSPSTAVPTPQP